MSEWLSSINQQTASAGEDVEKGEHFFTVHGNADWLSHCGKQYGDTSKIKYLSAFWSSDPTSGNISEETKNTNSKEHIHPYVHCSGIGNCQVMEAAQVSISRRVGKTTIGYLYKGILLGYKKEDNFSFVTIWMTWRILC